MLNENESTKEMIVKLFKDAITSFTERVRNRFFFPVIIVWMIHNWKVTLAILYIQSISYKKMERIIGDHYSITDWFLIPVGIGILYCVVSPYLSAGIFWIQKFGYLFEKNQISSAKESEISFRKSLIEERESIQKREAIANKIDADTIAKINDKRIFEKLNNLVSEHMLREAFDRFKDKEVQPNDYSNIKNYVYLSKSLEMEFSENEIQSLHNEFVQEIDELLNLINANFFNKDGYSVFSSTEVKDNEKYENNLSAIEPKVIAAYRKYREAVRSKYHI